MRVNKKRTRHTDLKSISDNGDKLFEGVLRAQATLSDNERRILDGFFKLSAGGLALSFTIFSFLSDKVSMNWIPVAINLSFYVIVILFELYSSYFAKKQAAYLKNFLLNRIISNEEMSGNSINELFDMANEKITSLNWITCILLISNILFTVIYVLIILF